MVCVGCIVGDQKHSFQNWTFLCKVCSLTALSFVDPFLTDTNSSKHQLDVKARLKYTEFCKFSKIYILLKLLFFDYLFSYRHTYVAICTHINCYASYTVLALKRCITTSQSLGITGLLLYLEYCDDIYNLVRLRQISCLSLSQNLQQCVNNVGLVRITLCVELLRPITELKYWYILTL